MVPISVLFVCLGNICRSPMAEGIFADMVAKAGIERAFSIDSAGTSSHHAGELADRRMRETARLHGIELVTRARQIRKQDFAEFDYIAAMDRSVLRDILALKKTETFGKAEIFLMRQYDPIQDAEDVPDPYYGGAEGFEAVFQILHRCNHHFLQRIRESHGI